MKDADQDIRYENIEILLALTGDDRNTFAEKLGQKDVNSISRILTKNKDKRRPISDKLARRIEVVYNKSFGWLDEPHKNQTVDSHHEPQDPQERHVSFIFRVTKHAIQVSGKNFSTEQLLRLYKRALDIAFDASVSEDQLSKILKILISSEA